MAELSPETLLAKTKPLLGAEAFAERRLGRALAFQTLYETDLAHHPPAQVMERLTAATLQEAGDLGYAPELVLGGLEYARELVDGVRHQRRVIDGLIQERAAASPLSQMSAVDRNVLRIGTYELLFRDDVPDGVAISEAVELATSLSTEESARFVNGVLARVARDRSQRS